MPTVPTLPTVPTELTIGEVSARAGMTQRHRLASPATSGSASHCMAIDVDDVEAHYTRTVGKGAELAHEPADMPYGVREYGARDPEGGLWSFMQPLGTGPGDE